MVSGIGFFLSKGDFVYGDLVPGGFCPGGFCPCTTLGTCVVGPAIHPFRSAVLWLSQPSSDLKILGIGDLGFGETG